MAKLSRELSAGLLNPRENLFNAGTLGAVNAEVVADCDGACTVAVDMRGTFSLTFTLEGTIDNTNWIPIAARSSSGGAMGLLFAWIRQRTGTLHLLLVLHMSFYFIAV